MPEHYSVDPSWELSEIFRSAVYVMPGLVPTFHIVARKDCDGLLAQLNLVRLEDAIK